MKIAIVNLICLICYPLVSYANHCHPLIDKSKHQFLIGYGSLMDESSKKDTLKSVKKNIPIILLNYKRGWFARGKMDNQNCTFLGVIKNHHHLLNAVVFELLGSEIKDFDRREKFYCRKLVAPQNINPLMTINHMNHAQFWIYQPSKLIFKKASPQYPIKQKYLNIFLNGCYQIQEKYGFSWFYQTCVQTTSDWQYLK